MDIKSAVRRVFYRVFSNDYSKASNRILGLILEANLFSGVLNMDFTHASLSGVAILLICKIEMYLNEIEGLKLANKL